MCSLFFLLSGGLNMLRDILPEFFSHRKCRLSKLKRFVRSLCKENDRPQVRALDSRAQLLRYITEWTENAHKHQLRALPNMLRRSGLQITARKVKEMLMRIEEKVSMCHNRIRFKEWAISLYHIQYTATHGVFPGVLLKLFLYFLWNSFSSMTNYHRNSCYSSVLSNSSLSFDNKSFCTRRRRKWKFLGKLTPRSLAFFPELNPDQDHV